MMSTHMVDDMVDWPSLAEVSLTSSTCVHDLNWQLQDDKICMQQSPVQCHYDIPQVKTSDFPLLPNLILYSPDLKLDVT